MATQPPNVLMIVADDLAWGDLGCHGSPLTVTPVLDRIHGTSVRLTRYCSGPLCTPARAALMTGRHPYRTRAIDTYLGRSMIDPDEVTLPALLRDAGYATGIFGKWHLGDNYPMRAIDMGFDEALVHQGGGLRQPANTGRDSYFHPDLVHNGKSTRFAGYCTDIFTDGAIDFIQRHANLPFFCYLATNAPHHPLEIAEEWVAPYRRDGVPETLARLSGMIANLDHNIGRVMEALQACGLADQTLVIFTSDHGPCPSTLIDGEGRYNGGLRGTKGTMYEGGIRVPCFWRWPARFPTGADVDRLANPIDVLPTVAALCGASPPQDRTIDGEDLTSLLTDPPSAVSRPDRTICMQWHRGDEPKRYRNAAAITQRWKWYSTGEEHEAELYDLLQDPREEYDLSDQHPDVRDSLRRQYDRWFDDVSATRPDNYAPPRIVIGHDREPTTCLTRQDWRLYDLAHEGWGVRYPGFWRVRVARSAPYRISLDLATGTCGRLHFRCGDARFACGVGPSTGGTVAFTAPLNAGEHDLEAYIEHDAGDRIGVERAWISFAPSRTPSTCS